MGNNFFHKTKQLSLIQQKLSLDACYKKSYSEISDHNRLLWIGCLQPTPISDRYTCIVKYKLYEQPETWITGENLRKLEVKDFPHKFSVMQNEKMVKLCLFRSKYNDWTTDLFIAKTIVPWAVEWLLHYEIWCITGQWNGGGEHPQIENIDIKKRAEIMAFNDANKS